MDQYVSHWQPKYRAQQNIPHQREKRGDGSIDRNVSHRLPTKIQGTAKHTTLRGEKRGDGSIDRNVSHRLQTKIQGTAKHTTLRGEKRGVGE